MKIRAGYDIAFSVPQRTPMVLMLSVHPSRTKDLLTNQRMLAEPNLPLREYRDTYGNICTRVPVEPGVVRFSSCFDILDSGRPDEVFANARQHPIDELPDDALVYLLGSRYCDTQKLCDFAWQTFAASKAGWERVQAICDFVHNFTTTSNLDTPTRGMTVPHSMLIVSGSVYAVTLRISRSHCAGA